MLTPNEVRTKLAQARATHHEASCWQVLELLEEVLPDLAAMTSGRSLEDAGRRHRDEVGAEQETIFVSYGREVAQHLDEVGGD